MTYNRKFVLPAAELIDRLAVDQIKEMLFDDNKTSYLKNLEIKRRVY